MYNIITEEDNNLNLNTNTARGDFDDSVLEVEAVEVDPDEEKKDPNPVARPPSPAGLNDTDRAELEAFTNRLLTNPKLIFALRSALGLKDEVGVKWIEGFALDQWMAGDLDKKTDAQWQQHCKRWIADQLAKQKENEQRPPRPGYPKWNRSGESRAETGSEIDRLVDEVFGT